MLDIEKYLLIEQSVKDIGEPTIEGVPIWKLVRTQFRWKYRDSRPFTVKPNIQIWELIRNSCISFKGLLLILLKNSKYDNVFFPHPRLFYVNGRFMERFSDSLIESAGIQKSTLIFERHQNGIHKRPRLHSEIVVYLDLLDNITRLLSPIMKIWIQKKYKNQVQDLYNKLDVSFHLNNLSYLDTFYGIITQFLVSRWLFMPILKIVSPKRVFFAPRGTYDYAVSICKKKKIETIELEHGIVIDKSDLYSGEYDQRIDPDYFFVFGIDNVGEQYGVPTNRVINIGFPFKNYVQGNTTRVLDENICLVASEPGITEKIIDVLISIVNQYPEYVFHIRCHPQEKLTSEQLRRISFFSNIQVADNSTESFSALSRYHTVIGEISSVLFEAMSLHKKVGRLNFGGLTSIETERLHGGTIIHSPQEFNEFMKLPYNDDKDSKDIYSDFNPEALKIIGL